MEKIIFKRINNFKDYIEEDENFAVVVDEKVYELYKELFPRDVFLLEAGECAKTKEVLFAILEYINKQNLGRNGVLYIVGGGSISDVANFAASIYMRGIKSVIVPTTFLSIVDASIGGKTAINFLGAKNNIGSFHSADKVIIDKSFLRSLEKIQINDGLVEGIKLAALYDRDIFLKIINYILTYDFQSAIDFLVDYAPKKKREIVFKDFKDKDERNFLNVGHTVGHFIESTTDYKISHGEAVLQGLILESSLGFSKSDISLTFEKIYEKLYGPLQFEDYRFDFSKDKKLKNQNRLRLPVIKDFGEREIFEVDKGWLEKELRLNIQKFFR